MQINPEQRTTEAMAHRLSVKYGFTINTDDLDDILKPTYSNSARLLMVILNELGFIEQINRSLDDLQLGAGTQNFDIEAFLLHVLNESSGEGSFDEFIKYGAEALARRPDIR